MTEGQTQWIRVIGATLAVAMGTVAALWPISPQSVLVWGGTQFHATYLIAVPLIAAFALFFFGLSKANKENQADEFIGCLVLASFAGVVFLFVKGATTIDVIQSINRVAGALLLASIAFAVAAFHFLMAREIRNGTILIWSIIAIAVLGIEWGLIAYSPPAGTGFDGMGWLGAPIRVASTLALGWLFFVLARVVIDALGSEASLPAGRVTRLLAGLSAVITAGLLYWYHGEQFTQDLYVAECRNKLSAAALESDVAKRIETQRRLRDEVAGHFPAELALENSVRSSLADSWKSHITDALRSNDLELSEARLDGARSDVELSELKSECDAVLTKYQLVIQKAVDQERLWDAEKLLQKAKLLAISYEDADQHAQFEVEATELKRQWCCDNVCALETFQGVQFTDGQVDLLWHGMLRSQLEGRTVLLASKDGRFLISTNGRVELGVIPEQSESNP